MRTLKKYWHVILLAAALVTWFSFLGLETTSDFQFIERASPKGFRDLASDDRPTSSLDPIFGVDQVDRAGESGGQQRRSALNVCSELFQDPDSPAVGDNGAEVTIVEFFDYQCPYCKVLVDILEQLKTEYDLRIIYKEWPILGESSKLAARAALAANRQGRYQDFHKKLMGSGFMPSSGYIEYLAADLGLDQPRLSSDMASDETTLALRRTSVLANELGFFGTPSLVVGRTIVQGAITRSELASLIEFEASSDLPGPC